MMSILLELFAQLNHTLMNCCLLFGWLLCEEYSQLDKYFVAVVEKSCANNYYSTIFANCENEATMYPGALCILTYILLFYTPSSLHGYTDGIPHDGSLVHVLDATSLTNLIVSMILFTVLLVLAGACLLFNLLFRQRK